MRSFTMINFQCFTLITVTVVIQSGVTTARTACDTDILNNMLQLQVERPGCRFVQRFCPDQAMTSETVKVIRNKLENSTCFDDIILYQGNYEHCVQSESSYHPTNHPPISDPPQEDLSTSETRSPTPSVRQGADTVTTNITISHPEQMSSSMDAISDSLITTMSMNFTEASSNNVTQTAPISSTPTTASNSTVMFISSTLPADISFSSTVGVSTSSQFGSLMTSPSSVNASVSTNVPSDLEPSPSEIPLPASQLTSMSTIASTITPISSQSGDSKNGTGSWKGILCTLVKQLPLFESEDRFNQTFFQEVATQGCGDVVLLMDLWYEVSQHCNGLGGGLPDTVQPCQPCVPQTSTTKAPVPAAAKGHSDAIVVVTGVVCFLVGLVLAGALLGFLYVRQVGLLCFKNDVTGEPPLRDRSSPKFEFTRHSTIDSDIRMHAVVPSDSQLGHVSLVRYDTAPSKPYTSTRKKGMFSDKSRDSNKLSNLARASTEPVKSCGGSSAQTFGKDTTKTIDPGDGLGISGDKNVILEESDSSHNSSKAGHFNHAAECNSISGEDSD